MKKARVFVILLCCFLSFSALTGCKNYFPGEHLSKETETENLTNIPEKLPDLQYKALELGSFDVDGGIHMSEYSTWDHDKLCYFRSDSAPAEKTVVFNGIKYTGLYSRSIVTVPRLYTTHTYQGDHVNFDINSETGELISIMFTETRTADTSSIDETECKKIADDIASMYIKLDEYRVDIRVSPIRDENYVCGFTYCKEVNEFKTADSMIIAVDGNGNIWSFGTVMLRSFKNVTDFSVDASKVTAAIENKISSIYQGVPTYDGYRIRLVTLIRLEDNSPALLYDINVDFVEFDSVEQLYYLTGSCIQLLIV